jgi:hypothetical protein
VPARLLYAKHPPQLWDVSLGDVFVVGSLSGFRILAGGPAAPRSYAEGMKSAKRIVFRYDGDPATEEIDLDMDGEKNSAGARYLYPT